MSISSKKSIAATALLLALLALGWLAYRAMPASERNMRSSTCLITGTVELCLADGSDTIAITTDSIRQQGVWVSRRWWWPDRQGRVLTIQPSTLLHPNDSADQLRRIVMAQADSLSRLLKRKDNERLELDYYLRSHGVIDEGYSQIAAYANRQLKETTLLKNTMARLHAIIQRDSTLAANRKPTRMRLIQKALCTLSWYDDADSLLTTACQPLVYSPIAPNSAQPIILHTVSSTKPWHAYAVRNVPWGAKRHTKVMTVTIAPEARKDSLPHRAILTTGNAQRSNANTQAQHNTANPRAQHNSNNLVHDLPQLFAVDGAPVFTLHGRFLGLVRGKEVVE